MIRVDIETIIMAAGPVPSVIVLRERTGGGDTSTRSRALSIQTGSYEAAAISQGINGDRKGRPITHDLALDCIGKLGARVERVEVNRVDGPVFYANVVLAREGEDEVAIDARPSDAIALAVRVNAPVYVEDDVMNRVGTVSHQTEENEEAEQAKFDEFVQSLSPDDF